jgi:hypothetical protein
VLSAIERERWNAAAQQIDDIQASIEVHQFIPSTVAPPPPFPP